jgi:hypothetical protein
MQGSFFSLLPFSNLDDHPQEGLAKLVTILRGKFKNKYVFGDLLESIF